MDTFVADLIGKKSRAFKHCDRLLSRIDKYGESIVKLNCTGVEFVVHRGDAIYLRLQALKYQLLDELHSMELVMLERTASGEETTAPPAEAAPKRRPGRPKKSGVKA